MRSVRGQIVVVWILRVLAAFLVLAMALVVLRWYRADPNDERLIAAIGAIGVAAALLVATFRLRAEPKNKRADKHAPDSLREASKKQQASWENEAASFAPLLADVRLEARVDDGSGEIEYFDSIEAALDRYGKFVLLGDAGAGKTTLLRQLALSKIKKYQDAQHQDYIIPFPVWVNLGDSTNPPSARALIEHSWRDRPRLDSDLQVDLDDDFLCLLFDGLNEMPDSLTGPGSLENRAKSLRDFLAKYDGPAVVTCRTGDYNERLNLNLPVVWILRLEQGVIAAFAWKRLGESGNDFLRALQDKRQALADNLFSLTMLLDLFEQTKRLLPDSREALYDQYIQHCYETNRLQADSRAAFPTIKRALGNLAYQMMRDGYGTSVDKAWAQRHVGGWLGISGPRNLIDAQNLSLIVEDADKQQISFYHPSLYEHFALPLIDLKRGSLNQRMTLVKRLGNLGKAALPALPMLIELFAEQSESANSALYNQAKRALVDIVIESSSDLSRRFVLEIYLETSLWLSLNLARTLHLDVALSHDVAHDRDRTLTLDVALDLAIDRARDRVRDLGYAYLHSEDFAITDARELGLALDLAHVRAHEVAQERDRAHARAHDLALALERAYARICTLARTLTLTVNLDYVNTPDGFAVLRKNVQQELRSLAHELIKDGESVKPTPQRQAQQR